MGGKPDDDTSIRSDRLELDFGKNKFRIDEKDGQAEHFKEERKLPPEPGRVPPATSVPWWKILNPLKKHER